MPINRQQFAFSVKIAGKQMNDLRELTSRIETAAVAFKALREGIGGVSDTIGKVVGKQNMQFASQIQALQSDVQQLKSDVGNLQTRLGASQAAVTAHQNQPAGLNAQSPQPAQQAFGLSPIDMGGLSRGKFLQRYGISKDFYEEHRPLRSSEKDTGKDPNLLGAGVRMPKPYMQGAMDPYQLLGIMMMRFSTTPIRKKLDEVATRIERAVGVGEQGTGVPRTAGLGGLTGLENSIAELAGVVKAQQMPETPGRISGVNFIQQRDRRNQGRVGEGSSTAVSMFGDAGAQVLQKQAADGGINREEVMRRGILKAFRLRLMGTTLGEVKKANPEMFGTLAEQVSKAVEPLVQQPEKPIATAISETYTEVLKNLQTTFKDKRHPARVEIESKNVEGHTLSAVQKDLNDALQMFASGKGNLQPLQDEITKTEKQGNVARQAIFEAMQTVLGAQVSAAEQMKHPVPQVVDIVSRGLADDTNMSNIKAKPHRAIGKFTENLASLINAPAKFAENVTGRSAKTDVDKEREEEALAEERRLNAMDKEIRARGYSPETRAAAANQAMQQHLYDVIRSGKVVHGNAARDLTPGQRAQGYQSLFEAYEKGAFGTKDEPGIGPRFGVEFQPLSQKRDDEKKNRHVMDLLTKFKEDVEGGKTIGPLALSMHGGGGGGFDAGEILKAIERLESPIREIDKNIRKMSALTGATKKGLTKQEQIDKLAKEQLEDDDETDLRSLGPGGVNVSSIIPNTRREHGMNPWARMLGTSELEKDPRPSRMRLPAHIRMQDTLIRSAMYAGSGLAIYGGITQVHRGVETMKDFESEVTKVRRVINPLGTDMHHVAESAQDMGKEFGVGITEVASIMASFASQGRTMADVINQTRTALMATNVTEITATEAVDALTSAQRQFNMTGSQSMRILDSWNALEAVSGVSVLKLADALKKAGIMSKTAGLSFDEFNGVAAAIGETTRKSGEAIGTAMKYIFTHISDNEAIDALQKVGIQTITMEGNFRSAKEVITDLSVKWNTLSDSQRKNLAVAVAGTEHTNDFIVMMEKWDRAGELTIDSLTSQGSAMRENDMAMTTLKKKLEALSASYQSFWQALGESGALDVIKHITDALTNMLNVAGGVNKLSHGLFGGVIGSLGAGGVAAAGMGLLGTGVNLGRGVAGSLMSTYSGFGGGMGPTAAPQSQAEMTAALRAQEALQSKVELYQRLMSRPGGPQTMSTLWKGAWKNSATKEMAVMYAAGFDPEGPGQRPLTVLGRAKFARVKARAEKMGLQPPAPPQPGPQDSAMLSEPVYAGDAQHPDLIGRVGGYTRPRYQAQPSMARYLAPIGVMAGAAAIRSSYHEMYPDDQFGTPSKTSTAVDVGTTALSTGAMMSMFWKTGVEGGLMKKVGGQGWARLIPLALMTISLVSDVYKSLQEYRGKATNENDQQNELRRLQALEQQISQVKNLSAETMVAARKGNVEPSAVGDLMDMIRAISPNAKIANSGDVVQDIQSAMPYIEKVGNETRSTKALVVRAMAARTLSSKDVQDALTRRNTLDQEAKAGKGDLNARLSRLGEQMELRQKISGKLTPLFAADAYETGKSGGGFGHLTRDYLNQYAVAQQTGPESIAKDYLHKALEVGANKNVDVDKAIGSKDIFKVIQEGFLQKQKGGPIFRLVDMKEVSDVGKNVDAWVKKMQDGGGTVIQAWKGLDTIVVSAPQQMQRLVADLNESINRLTVRNQLLVNSAAQVSQSLSRLGGGPEAGTMTGETIRGVLREGRALEIPEQQGVKEFSEPIHYNDTRSAAMSLREVTGDIISKSQSPQGISLEGLMSATQVLNRTMEGARDAGEAYLKRFLNRGSYQELGIPQDMSETTPNDAAKLISDVAPRVFDQLKQIQERISSLESKPENEKTPEVKGEIDRLTKAAFNLFTDAVRTDGRDTIRMLAEKIGGITGTYTQLSQRTIEALGEQYKHEYQTGTSMPMQQFLTRPDVAPAVETLGTRRDRLSDLVTRQREEVKKVQASGDPRQLQQATETLNLFEAALKATSYEMDHLGMLVAGAGKGMLENARAMTLATHAAQQGPAFGRSGLNVDIFALKSLQKELTTQQGRLNRGEISEKAFNTEILPQLSAQIEEALTSAETKKQTGEALKAGLFESVMNRRLATMMGVMEPESQGARPFAENLLKQIQQQGQRVIEAFSPDLQKMDKTSQSQFLQKLSDLLQPPGSKTRELAMSMNTGFQKNYLLATPGQQILADNILSLMHKGVSTSEIFASPDMKDAARNMPMVQDLMQMGLENDLATRAMDLSSKIVTNTDTLPQILTVLNNLARSMGGKGIDVTPGLVQSLSKPTRPSVGASPAGGGAPDVSGTGQISKDEIWAKLHKDEVVLSPPEAKAYIEQQKEADKNSFDVGTMAYGSSPLRKSPFMQEYNRRMKAWEAAGNKPEDGSIAQDTFKSLRYRHLSEPGSIPILVNRIGNQELPGSLLTRNDSSLGLASVAFRNQFPRMWQRQLMDNQYKINVVEDAGEWGLLSKEIAGIEDIDPRYATEGFYERNSNESWVNASSSFKSSPRDIIHNILHETAHSKFEYNDGYRRSPIGRFQSYNSAFDKGVNEKFLAIASREHQQMLEPLGFSPELLKDVRLYTPELYTNQFNPETMGKLKTTLDSLHSKTYSSGMPKLALDWYLMNGGDKGNFGDQAQLAYYSALMHSNPKSVVGEIYADTMAQSMTSKIGVNLQQSKFGAWTRKYGKTKAFMDEMIGAAHKGIDDNELQSLGIGRYTEDTNLIRKCILEQWKPYKTDAFLSGISNDTYSRMDQSYNFGESMVKYIDDPRSFYSPVMKSRPRWAGVMQGDRLQSAMMYHMKGDWEIGDGGFLPSSLFMDYVSNAPWNLNKDVPEHTELPLAATKLFHKVARDAFHSGTDLITGVPSDMAKTYWPRHGFKMTEQGLMKMRMTGEEPWLKSDELMSEGLGSQAFIEHIIGQMSPDTVGKTPTKHSIDGFEAYLHGHQNQADKDIALEMLQFTLDKTPSIWKELFKSGPKGPMQFHLDDSYPRRVSGFHSSASRKGFGNPAFSYLNTYRLVGANKMLAGKPHSGVFQANLDNQFLEMHATGVHEIAHAFDAAIMPESTMPRRYADLHQRLSDYHPALVAGAEKVYNPPTAEFQKITQQYHGNSNLATEIFADSAMAVHGYVPAYMETEFQDTNFNHIDWFKEAFDKPTDYVKRLYEEAHAWPAGKLEEYKKHVLSEVDQSQFEHYSEGIGAKYTPERLAKIKANGGLIGRLSPYVDWTQPRTPLNQHLEEVAGDTEGIGMPGWHFRKTIQDERWAAFPWGRNGMPMFIGGKHLDPVVERARIEQARGIETPDYKDPIIARMWASTLGADLHDRTLEDVRGLTHQQLIAELATRNLSHAGTGDISRINTQMGAKEFYGTYFSTERFNRYQMGGTKSSWWTKWRPKSPKIFRDPHSYSAYREQFLPKGKTVEDDIEERDFMIRAKQPYHGAAEMATEQLIKEGHDSVYLPQSEYSEGILVGLQPEKIKLRSVYGELRSEAPVDPSPFKAGLPEHVTEMGTKYWLAMHPDFDPKMVMSGKTPITSFTDMMETHGNDIEGKFETTENVFAIIKQAEQEIINQGLGHGLGSFATSKLMSSAKHGNYLWAGPNLTDPKAKGKASYSPMEFEGDLKDFENPNKLLRYTKKFMDRPVIRLNAISGTGADIYDRNRVAVGSAIRELRHELTHRALGTYLDPVNIGGEAYTRPSQLRINRQLIGHLLTTDNATTREAMSGVMMHGSYAKLLKDAKINKPGWEYNRSISKFINEVMVAANNLEQEKLAQGKPVVHDEVLAATIKLGAKYGSKIGESMQSGTLTTGGLGKIYGSGDRELIAKLEEMNVPVVRSGQTLSPTAFYGDRVPATMFEGTQQPARRVYNRPSPERVGFNEPMELENTGFRRLSKQQMMDMLAAPNNGAGAVPRRSIGEILNPPEMPTARRSRIPGFLRTLMDPKARQDMRWQIFGQPENTGPRRFPQESIFARAGKRFDLGRDNLYAGIGRTVGSARWWLNQANRPIQATIRAGRRFGGAVSDVYGGLSNAVSSRYNTAREFVMGREGFQSGSMEQEFSQARVGPVWERASQAASRGFARVPGAIDRSLRFANKYLTPERIAAYTIENGFNLTNRGIMAGVRGVRKGIKAIPGLFEVPKAAPRPVMQVPRDSMIPTMAEINNPEYAIPGLKTENTGGWFSRNRRTVNRMDRFLSSASGGQEGARGLSAFEKAGMTMFGPRAFAKAGKMGRFAMGLGEAGVNVAMMADFGLSMLDMTGSEWQKSEGMQVVRKPLHWLGQSAFPEMLINTGHIIPFGLDQKLLDAGASRFAGMAGGDLAAGGNRTAQMLMETRGLTAEAAAERAFAMSEESVGIGARLAGGTSRVLGGLSKGLNVGARALGWAMLPAVVHESSSALAGGAYKGLEWTGAISHGDAETIAGANEGQTHFGQDVLWNMPKAALFSAINYATGWNRDEQGNRTLVSKYSDWNRIGQEQRERDFFRKRLIESWKQDPDRKNQAKSEYDSWLPRTLDTVVTGALSPIVSNLPKDFKARFVAAMNTDMAHKYTVGEMDMERTQSALDIEHLLDVPLLNLAPADQKRTASELLMTSKMTTGLPMEGGHKTDIEGQVAGVVSARQVLEGKLAQENEFVKNYGGKVPQENQDKIRQVQLEIRGLKLQEAELSEVLRLQGSVLPGSAETSNPADPRNLANTALSGLALRNASKEAFVHQKQQGADVLLKAFEKMYPGVKIDEETRQALIEASGDANPLTTGRDMLNKALLARHLNKGDVANMLPGSKQMFEGMPGVNAQKEAGRQTIENFFLATLTKTSADRVKANNKVEWTGIDAINGPVGATEMWENLKAQTLTPDIPIVQGFEAEREASKKSYSDYLQNTDSFTRDAKAVKSAIGKVDGRDPNVLTKLDTLRRAMGRGLADKHQAMLDAYRQTVGDGQTPGHLQSMANEFKNLNKTLQRQMVGAELLPKDITGSRLLGVPDPSAPTEQEQLWNELQAMETQMEDNAPWVGKAVQAFDELQKVQKEDAYNNTFIQTKGLKGADYRAANTHDNLLTRRNKYNMAMGEVTQDIAQRLMSDKKHPANVDMFWDALDKRTGQKSLGHIGKEYATLTDQIEQIKAKTPDWEKSSQLSTQMYDLMGLRADLTSGMSTGTEFNDKLLQQIYQTSKKFAPVPGSDLDLQGGSPRHTGGPMIKDVNYTAKSNEWALPYKYYDAAMKMATSNDNFDSFSEDVKQYTAGNGPESSSISHDVNGQVQLTMDGGLQQLLKDVHESIRGGMRNTGKGSYGDIIPNRLTMNKG